MQSSAMQHGANQIIHVTTTTQHNTAASSNTTLTLTPSHESGPCAPFIKKVHKLMYY